MLSILIVACIDRKAQKNLNSTSLNTNLLHGKSQTFCVLYHRFFMVFLRYEGGLERIEP